MAPIRRTLMVACAPGFVRHLAIALPGIHLRGPENTAMFEVVIRAFFSLIRNWSRQRIAILGRGELCI